MVGGTGDDVMVGGSGDGGWDRGWWVGQGMVGGSGDGGWVHHQAEKPWLCLVLAVEQLVLGEPFSFLSMNELREQSPHL